MNRRHFFKASLASAALASVSPLELIAAAAKPKTQDVQALGLPPDEFFCDKIGPYQSLSVIQWVTYHWKCPLLVVGTFQQYPTDGGLPVKFLELLHGHYANLNWTRSTDFLTVLSGKWCRVSRQWLGLSEKWDWEFYS